MSKRTTATCYCGAIQLEVSKAKASSTLTPVTAKIAGMSQERCSPRMQVTFSAHPCLLYSDIQHQLTVETPHLRHLRGEDKLSAYATAKTINTGNTMTSFFCKICGALMYRRSSGFPGLSFCRIGTVDDIGLHDEVLKPMAEQFTVSRAKWLEPVEGVRQTEGMSTE